MVDIGDIFADIEMEMVANLSSSMASEDWKSQRLRALKQFQKRNEDILKKFGAKTEATKQIEDAYLKAGYKTRAEIKEAMSYAIQSGTSFSVSDRRLQALLGQLNEDLSRAETAAVRMMNDVYRQTAARSQVAMATNLYTMEQAVDMATKDFLDRGINCIQYKNGAQVNIASYADMAVRTSNRRATLLGEGAMRGDLGQNLVYITQYGACSDTCLPWQGRVYCDDVYTMGPPNDDYQRLSEAIAGGLFHPNCRHKSSTWYPGISKLPTIMDEEIVQRNSALEADQRYNERQIRKYKRLAEGSLDEKNKAKYQSKVSQWQLRQRQHINSNPDILRRDYGREKIKVVSGEKKLPK